MGSVLSEQGRERVAGSSRRFGRDSRRTIRSRRCSRAPSAGRGSDSSPPPRLSRRARGPFGSPCPLATGRCYRCRGRRPSSGVPNGTW
ncbi:MAG: hypothetical protein FJ291_00005 [Planctomycetes bacterium]|nr:hypothetical protein [Planctomycetota bacterium]